VFTVDFDTDTSNGTFNFGYIDASKYSGSISYANVNQSFGGGWTIPISGQELSNGTFLSSDNWWVTIDTGTAGATIPRNAADAYFSQVSGSRFDTGRGVYTFPCTTKLPDFTFGIGSAKLSILGAHLVSDSGSFDNGKTCTSKLNAGTGDGPYLWGQSFIQEFFVVFDWSQGGVGFASKASSSNTSGPSSTSSPQRTTATGQASSTASASEATSSYSGVYLGIIHGVVVSLLTIVLQT
jgi:aspergillopepsin I